MIMANLKFILLQFCIIVTLYQLATCLAEEQSVLPQTGTLQPPESQSDTEAIQSPRQQCTNSIHGVPGIPGIPGSPGPVGAPGLKGNDGQVGPMGFKGDIGPPGENGEKGSPGSKGDKGDYGANGQMGQKGVQGKPGPKGVQGDLGQKGSTGQSGPTGPKGQQGPPGQQGQKGDKGHAGEIQHPSRMAFSVVRTSSLGPVSSHTTVIYNKVYSNVGNGYSSSTGKFTCSVSGVYFFMISGMRIYSYSTNMYICLMKNNEKLPCVYVDDTGGRKYGAASTSVIIDLEEGDEVWVRLGNGYALYSDSDEYASFTGYLLHENS
ncbi:complement C1q and tumor necrosis factor-related protein 9-like [Ptychodera flava]|uniref:complement C1q and tumor necrosis factor-related protein 9-like n=1 Tax=Ptychodera flava TaxID=63121 RepID=UPI003969F649